MSAGICSDEKDKEAELEISAERWIGCRQSGWMQSAEH
jgi:hypothetical protein